MRVSVWFFTILAALFLPSAGGATGPATPADLAKTYLQAVLRNDWPEARDLWMPGDVGDSERLEISYTDVPFKGDCASLLVLERRRIESGQIEAFVGDITVEGTSAQIPFLLQIGEETAVTQYHAVHTRNGWRFTSPVSALSAGWDRRSTEFLDLHIQPSRPISEEAIRALDRFVGEACVRLGVSPDRIDLLRARKLGYYLCDESNVDRIVGATTRGAAWLPSDAVVTSEPCHLHELAHLLVNFARKDLPLYTMPFLQEGVAVALGGRWGRSSGVMQGLGKFTLQSGMLSIEELFSWQEFRDQAADWTYAPSGVFAGFLLDSLDSEQFLRLYGQLSGPWSELQQMSRSTVQEAICTAAKTDWATLQSRFSDYLEALPCGAIVPADSCIGERAAHWQGDSVTATASTGNSFICWDIDAPATTLSFAVLFLESAPSGRPTEPTGASSRLFAEQFPERVYNGEVMAIVFAPGEIGVYDFRTDLLVAKFIDSFCPQQPWFETGDPNGRDRRRFRIPAELFPNAPWHAELIADRP